MNPIDPSCWKDYDEQRIRPATPRIPIVDGVPDVNAPLITDPASSDTPKRSNELLESGIVQLQLQNRRLQADIAMLRNAICAAFETDDIEQLRQKWRDLRTAGHEKKADLIAVLLLTQ